MFNCIIFHYGELALKGGNRSLFEDKLAKDIRLKLEKKFPGVFESVKKYHGRIILRLNTDVKIGQEDVAKKIKTIFGIANFSFAQELNQDINEIQNSIWKIIKDMKFKTFRITTQRSEKDFPFNSQQINERIGAFIQKKSGGKVKLKNAQLNCCVELANKKAYIHFEKIKGAGGMPVGSSAKSIVLLSGGIDSPVAAYYAMKRGTNPIYVHFHSMPFTTQKSIDKVNELAKILTKYNREAKIYLIPFADIQKEIMLKTEPKPRVILYRRIMFRIAEEIATKENAFAIYTGDSLAQVASQTMENINAIEEAVKIPVLRPLIGFDKEEIMEMAKKLELMKLRFSLTMTVAHASFQNIPNYLQTLKR
jgi:tRNA uracil 4-sulfurtransferase